MKSSYWLLHCGIDDDELVEVVVEDNDMVHDQEAQRQLPLANKVSELCFEEI